MILPDKHISTEHSLLGAGAAILGKLSRPTTVTRLWHAFRDDPTIGNYERFVLVLDFLYAAGAIKYDEGLLVRVTP